MRFGFPLALDQPRQREHDRNAGDKNEQWKDEIVTAKPLPLGMSHLSAKKFAHGTEHRTLVAQHALKSYHRAIGTDNPKNAEPAHRIHRKDAAGLQSA